MIPDSNRGAAVLQVPFDRINNLAAAVQAAAILPARVPAGSGWREYIQDIPRLGLKLRLRYALTFGAPRIDAWQPDSGADEVRLAVAIAEADFALAVMDDTSGEVLDEITYRLSGRVGIAGSFSIDVDRKTVFFVFREVDVALDDSSAGLPPAIPPLDIEKIVTRLADREVRVQLFGPDALPEQQLPVTPRLDATPFVGAMLSLGFALRDPSLGGDWFSHHVCLPTGIGDPACAPGAGENRRFYRAVDLYGVLTGAPPGRIVRLGPALQLDIGRDLLDRAIATLANKPDWSGQKEALAGLFRLTWQFRAYIDRWPGLTDGSMGFFASFHAEQDIAYPEIVWCKKKVFGIEIPYPCGLRKGWQPVRTLDASLGLRPYIDNDNLCFQRTDFAPVAGVNIIGLIMEIALEALASLAPIVGEIIGATAAFVETVLLFAALLVMLLGRLIDAVLPHEVCFPLRDAFARVELIGERVTASLANPALEFKDNGLSIAVDAGFQGAPH